MKTASEVFDHHLEVFGAGDIEGIVSDYTEDTVMLYGDKMWRGLDGARAFFAMWLDDLLPVGCRFDVVHRQTTDDIVYITWTAESGKYIFDHGTNTFLIQDGKIMRQTVATSHRAK